MTPNLNYDREHIERTYDLLAYIERDLGLPSEGKHSRSPKWLCPLHSEKTPSFTVNVDKARWICYGCGKKGNIIDYVMYRQFGDKSTSVDVYKRACDAITGHSEPIFRKPESILTVPDKPTYEELSYEQVANWALDNRAKPYFTGRKLSEKSIDEHLLGAMDAPRPYDMDGEKIWFKSPRYTIPYLSGKIVRGLTKRRDDIAARQVLAETEPELLYEIRCHYAKNRDNLEASQVTDDMLLNILFGGKYIKNTGTSFPVFNINRLYKLESNGDLLLQNDKPVLESLPYLIITEGGEIDCMSAENSGYFSVAASFKLGVNYQAIFSRVFVPVLVQEPDQHGTEWAASMSAALNNPRTRIVRPLNGFHDINEMACAGAMGDWAAGLRIRPTLEVRA